MVFFSFLIAEQSWAAMKGKLYIFSTDVYAPLKKRMEEIIEEYKKVNPEVEVTLEVVSWGGSLAKLAAMKAAGTPPDICFVIPDSMWTLKQRGWLMPVDDVIEKLGGDKFFLPLPIFTKVDGHYWGVPKGSYTNHIIFRKDLFEKKGIKKTPRTWDDLLTAAKALTEDLDGDGKIDRYGIVLPLKRDYAVSTMFLSFLWGNGGNVLDKQGNVVFNSPETVQTMKFFKELYRYAPPGVTDYSWLQLIETYTQDKAAITSYSALSVLSKAIEKDSKIAEGTDICPYPTRLASQEPKARWGNESWIIFKDSKSPEVAKDFIMFFMEPKRLIKYYHTDQIYVVPGENPVVKSKEYWEGNLIKKYRDVIDKYIYEISKSGVEPAMEHQGIVQPNTSIINQRLILTDAIQEVVLGKLSAEDAVAKAHTRMKELVVELGK
jgi:multiple sugar transport system substrate-binding protein